MNFPGALKDKIININKNAGRVKIETDFILRKLLLGNLIAIIQDILIDDGLRVVNQDIEIVIIAQVKDIISDCDSDSEIFPSFLVGINCKKKDNLQRFRKE